MTARSWDAAAYHRVSGPMEQMGREVLDRLPLDGDEVVLDAGCGTGRVTALLAERLPRGRVIAVDADPGMVAAARVTLAPFSARVEVRQADLLDLRLDAPVDAVLSTATLHWVLDHDRLFAVLAAALRPGGRLVAQCGGAGNIVGVLATADAVAAELAPEAVAGWTRPTTFASAEATAARLERSGFTDVRCRLTPRPVVPEDPRAYTATVTLGAHLDRLPAALREPFLDEVLARLPTPLTVDYVRLDIDASRGRGLDADERR